MNITKENVDYKRIYDLTKEDCDMTDFGDDERYIDYKKQYEKSDNYNSGNLNFHPAHLLSYNGFQVEL